VLKLTFPNLLELSGYLKMFERASNLFPGFDTEIQGVYREVNGTGAVRFYTYVVRE
jgi:arginine/lysine/ornithine decarboxylase